MKRSDVYLIWNLCDLFADIIQLWQNNLRSFPRKRPAKKTISSSSVFSTIDAFLQIRMEIFTDKTPSIISIETLFSVAVSWTTLSHKVHLFPKYSFWVTSYEQTEELLAKQIQTRKGRTTVQAITLTLEKIVEFYATKG